MTVREDAMDRPFKTYKNCYLFSREAIKYFVGYQFFGLQLFLFALETEKKLSSSLSLKSKESNRETVHRCDDPREKGE